MAILTFVFAMSWWIWLWSLKVAVSDGHIEYRNGFFKSKIPLSYIADIRDENLRLEVILEQNKIPRLFFILLRGNVGIDLDTKPFSRKDLGKILKAIIKTGCACSNIYPGLKIIPAEPAENQ